MLIVFIFLYQSLRFYAKVITGKTQTNEAHDLQLINFFSLYQQIKITIRSKVMYYLYYFVSIINYLSSFKMRIVFYDR